MSSIFDQQAMMRLLDEVEETLTAMEQCCLRAGEQGWEEALQIIFRGAHNIKGAAQLYGLETLGQFVHQFEGLIDDLVKKKSLVGPATVDLMLDVISFSDEWVSALRQDLAFVADHAPLGRAIAEERRRLGESPTLKGDGLAPSEAAVAAPAPPVEIGGRASRLRARQLGTLRVPSTKIDEVMQLVGEILIQQSILSQGQATHTLNSELCRNAISLNRKSIEELQNLVLGLRLQPMDTLFQRLERAARDAGRQLNKEVKLNFIGADVLLDKGVIENMSDPLIHIIRNAIDHGIEDAATRRLRHKPGHGNLQIEARHEIGQVTIHIVDDGQGLDPKFIRRRAEERGIVAPGIVLSEAETYNLILRPGFSTREKVTAISGRGVGLDVVEQAVTQIAGRIEIKSQVGAFTSFSIYLPTSVEVVDGLVIELDGERYIAPLREVMEIVDLNVYPPQTRGPRGQAIRLRDEVIPLEHLRRYVRPTGATREVVGRGAGSVGLLIQLPGAGRLALRVDRVHAQQSVVIKPMTPWLANVPGFAGVTVLEGGEPGMILDFAFIAQAYAEQNLPAPGEVAA